MPREAMIFATPWAVLVLYETAVVRTVGTVVCTAGAGLAAYDTVRTGAASTLRAVYVAGVVPAG